MTDYPVHWQDSSDNPPATCWYYNKFAIHPILKSKSSSRSILLDYLPLWWKKCPDYLLEQTCEKIPSRVAFWLLDYYTFITNFFSRSNLDLSPLHGQWLIWTDQGSWWWISCYNSFLLRYWQCYKIYGPKLQVTRTTLTFCL